MDEKKFLAVPSDLELDMSIAFAEVFFSKRRGPHDDCDDDQDWYSAMLAAAPTAHVAVPRGLFEQMANWALGAIDDPGHETARAIEALRALLSQKGE